MSEIRGLHPEVMDALIRQVCVRLQDEARGIRVAQPRRARATVRKDHGAGGVIDGVVVSSHVVTGRELEG